MSFLALLLLLFVASSAFAACPADTIFDPRFNKCYKFVTQPASFLLAEKNCESIGGSLVSVSNAFENTFISGIAAYNESTIQFWIGMNLLYYNQWTWINGDSSSFRNWAQDQPTSGPRCGTIQVVDTLWTTAQYNASLPYMCQNDPDAAPVNSCSTPSAPVTTTCPTLTCPVTTACPKTTCPTPSVPVTTACPGYTGSYGHCADPGYVLNPDTCKCYRNIESYMTYNQSVDQCASEGATLPIILNANDNRFLANLVSSDNADYNMWLGLYCTGNTNASCTWQDGTPLLQGFINFSAGHPIANQFAYMYTPDQRWGTERSSYPINCACQKNGIP